MVEGVCLLLVLIGRLGRHGTGLVGMLNEVPAEVEHKFGPPAVQCDSQLELELIQTHMAQKPVLRVEEGGVLIRARDKHSEKLIKCRASGTSLNAKVGVPPSIGSSHC